jgi:hypothetical protein
LKQRVIIKFVSIEGRTIDEILTQLLPLNREIIYILVIIYKRNREFRTEWISIFDELCSGEQSINHVDADILL